MTLARKLLAVAPAGGFFGQYSMFHEFWAEDPSWSPPSEGADVTSWRNNGSNGTAYTEATNPPSYTATGSSGKPSIVFVAGERLSISPAATPTLTQTFTIVAVCSTTDVAYGENQFIAKNESGTDVLLRVEKNQPDLGIYAGTLQDSGQNATVSTTHLMTAVYKGATSRLDLDGSTGADKNIGTNSLDGLLTGAQVGGAGAGSLKGDMSYLAVYGGDLTVQSGFSDWETAILTHYGI